MLFITYIKQFKKENEIFFLATIKITEEIIIYNNKNNNKNNMNKDFKEFLGIGNTINAAIKDLINTLQNFGLHGKLQIIKDIKS